MDGIQAKAWQFVISNQQNYAKKPQAGTIEAMDNQIPEVSDTGGVEALAAWRQDSDAQRWARLADRSVPGTEVESEHRSNQLLQHLGLTEPEDAESAEDLKDAARILTRFEADNGNRTDLNTVMEMFGFDRDTLQTEIDEEQAAETLLD